MNENFIELTFVQDELFKGMEQYTWTLCKDFHEKRIIGDVTASSKIKVLQIF